jgi:hypothetical protein
MSIERYDHYGKPRLTVVEGGAAFLIRDVLSEDGTFSGVCENAVYDEADGEIRWRVCREGAEFSQIAPFIRAKS